MATLTNDNALLRVLCQLWPDIPAGSWEIRPLTGLTQGSYFITYNDITHNDITNDVRQMVGRTLTLHGETLGVDRQRENQILRRLSSTGIAPKVIAMHGTWLLLEWLTGTTVKPGTLGQPALQQSLAQTLAILHSRPLLGYPLQLKKQMAFQWQQIDRKRLSPRWLRLHKFFMATRMPTALKVAPAHMDIHPDNLLMTEEGLKLIDWEYAADVDIGLSLAVLFKGNQWDEMQQKTFLNYYCTQTSGYLHLPLLQRQIQRWEPWVSYMMLMWYEVRWQQTKEQQFLLLAHPLRQAFKLS
ncbi:phosphotransferase [Xenorhabdus sp. DI]|uniref:phosphotransferase n=1 Tax=Xenorhabdus doucetiae TaxID=351671 RepID=UPI00198E67DC|nr:MULTISPECIES: phosphotransferase [unclassified Xenorhabdus]MBD2783597.1 phosphotransferase [Xenorhabdus sp. 3]MBD2789730.1 phosphotransferase [Xenorhabdus sp. DI]MBD2795178.1 phosphotransferase [Xenorhabdus sp. 18]